MFDRFNQKKLFFCGLLWKGIFAALAAVTGLWLVSSSVLAQSPTPPPTISDDEINAIARELYCPVCENIPLDVCSTQACAQWRSLIKEKIELGWTEEQIKEYFSAQYGDRVLAEPPRRGLNWLVYLMPLIFFLIGVAILLRVFNRIRGASQLPAEQPGENSPVVDEAYLARMEEELRRRTEK